MLDPIAVNPQHAPLPGFVLVGAVCLLVAIWLLTWRWRHAIAWSQRRLWILAGCWSLPLVVGPPLMSDDVSSYAAQGLMVSRGLSPYSVGPLALGQSAALRAVDPVWRQAHSPYGPLATAVEHLSSVVGRGPFGTVVMLRLFSVVSVVVIGRLALGITRPLLQPGVFLLTVANPLTLLEVVSGAHLEGMMCALLLGALVALRRERPYLALALACGAGLVKAPGLILVVVIAAVAWRAKPQRLAATAARIAVTVGVSVAALSSLIPNGWGWLKTLGTPGQGYTPAAPVSLLSAALTPPIVWTGLASKGTLQTGCRLAAIALALVVIAWLVITIHRRGPVRTAGWALLAASLLGPVIYPWYLLWGIVCLACAAKDRERHWLILLSAVGSMMDIPGLAKPSVIAVAAVVGSATIGCIAWLTWTTLREHDWIQRTAVIPIAEPGAVRPDGQPA